MPKAASLVLHRHQHYLGLLLVTGSAIAYSTAGYFTRLIPLDAWNLLFWRGLFAGAFMAILLAIRTVRWGWRPVPWSSWLVAGLSTAGMLCFLSALRAAPVADVALIYATAPFVTALIAWFAIGERSPPRTLIASIIALIGVSIMVGDGWTAGHWRGDLLAFGMTVAMSALTVAIRRHRETDAVQAACISCFLGSVIAVPLTSIQGISLVEVGQLALFGVAQMGLGFLLLTAGTKLVSATESALIGALDAPLAPLWVWLAFGESVSQATWIGGGVILVAVGGDSVLASRLMTRKAAAVG